MTVARGYLAYDMTLLHPGPSSQNFQPLTFPNHAQPRDPPTDHKAVDLANRTFAYFYSSQNAQFQAKVKSEGTLGENDHFGYTVWSVIIMVQAVSECLPIHRITQSVAGLQAYWNPHRHGFCAWKMFPGNDDIYYDDNAHAAQALITVHEATGDARYLAQAKSILNDLIIPASQDGGVPWHVSDHSKRHACSTGPAAVAALRLCALQHDQTLFAFAGRALSWLEANLQDPQDGLIWDNLKHGPDGTIIIEKKKWTYNTGFAIHGFTLLYEMTRNRQNLDRATRIARSAIHPFSALHDQSIPDPVARMYSDGSFFLHHLVDGYAALARHADHGMLRREIIHIADFGREFMYDSSDGLCFRGSRPYTISEATTQRFNQRYGGEKALEPSHDERDEHGNLCKTLIGNAGWIRVLLAPEK